jgi:hypothetical protein
MTRSAAVTVIAGALLLAGCSAPSATLTGPTAATPSPPASPSPSATPTPPPQPTATPTPTPTPGNPLTGQPGVPARPVLVVKLDNTRNAQPHAGLSRADVVYLEEVEYGITRIAAVFATEVPDRIGPVRSARITDIDLLASYGRPALAYSGAQSRMYPVIDAAPFFDVSPRRGIEGYARDTSRRAPYNLFVDGTVALDRAPKASAAREQGWVFDPVVPIGGSPATRLDLAWADSEATFRYDQESADYRVRLNGEKAESEESPRGQRAATVVVQFVKQTPSQYADRYGGRTPLAHLVGKGRGIVLRDGKAWDVRWSRPSEKDGTTFTLADGSPLPFKPGQTWIVLYDRERSAVIEPSRPGGQE